MRQLTIRTVGNHDKRRIWSISDLCSLTSSALPIEPGFEGAQMTDAQFSDFSMHHTKLTNISGGKDDLCPMRSLTACHMFIKQACYVN